MTVKYNTYEQRKQALFAYMETLTRQDVLIAFSGGADSGVLLKVACDIARKHGTRVFAVTVHTPLHPIREREAAEKEARAMGAMWAMIELDVIYKAKIEQNPADRCYRCKKSIFTELCRFAESQGIETILDGTNIDDLHQYRPGIKALKELGIISPLAQCGINKKEVRMLGESYGLKIADKPASPCLATRFPYGAPLSYKAMECVEQGETFLKHVGLYNIRLRIHGDVARIEADAKDFERLLQHKDSIISYLKNLGYVYITMDLEGFRSGSMDEVLDRYE